ncbi:MAG: universal stress protein [Pirellulales bacterium]|nr:universal stress protein [Pirellulales bacterium]
MKILIGVDGSNGSFEAIKFAVRFVDGARDQIAFYYSPVEVPLKSEQDAGPEMRQRARQALADAVFLEARKRLPEALASAVHTIVGTQQPAHGLIVAADSWRADVIAVGARGLGPIQSMFLGSVSRQVVQVGSVPVLVVRPDSTPSDPAVRLLLAYDPASAQQQAEITSQFKWPVGTRGQVIRVVESMLAGPLPAWLEQQARDADCEAMAQAWVLEHAKEVQQQREEVTAYLQKLPFVFHGHAPIVVEGHVGDQILKAIKANNIDIAILGKTAGGALKRMLVGSTSAQILNNAPCSVLVVPLHEIP